MQAQDEEHIFGAQVVFPCTSMEAISDAQRGTREGEGDDGIRRG